ncbi:MAG: prepilin peptidase [Phycisphaerales bacterium]|nr:prepilin peptidase [Phycisphaerales bacterium]
MLLALDVVKLLFVTAVGACVGSLINVLVYRLPLGLSVVTPPSRCPSCQTQLTWRENIPVFGWILLRGRCRFCKVRISPEYPIVEAIVAGLFALFFALWYLVPTPAVWLGIDWGAVKPEWAQNGEGQTWPVFVVLMFLVGSLVAMTIVDAKTTTIPLVLAWVPAIVAVVVLPAHALWFQLKYHRGLYHLADGAVWTLPAPGPFEWGVIGACIGGVLGLGIGNLLLSAGLIRRSFADYEEWEKSVTGPGVGALPDGGVGPSATPGPHGHPILAADVVLAPEAPAPVATGAQPTAGPENVAQRPEELWIQYPHARREMFKEIIFLAPCLGLGMAGMLLARHLTGQQATWTPQGPVAVAQAAAPLWLQVLGGVLLGYLAGGGIVWGTRILGSLAAGREAMGLGDVHLMAAVGACLGWIDAVLAFFGAAFVGLAWQLMGKIFSGVFRRAMPYGPCLAVATLLVLLLKPLIEVGLSRLLHRPVDLP